MIRLSRATRLSLSFVLLFAAPCLAQAAQSFDNCAGYITSLPAVITTQGTWCLKQDLATAINTGNAITINADDVTIDCNDYKLGGLAAGIGTQANGIVAGNRLNIAIRNCNIRGFLYGAFLWGSQGGAHVVEDNRFDLNTYIALLVAGDGSVVRRNRVFNTGGTTVAMPSDGALGIGVQYSADVIDNTVSGVHATSGTNGTVAGISAQFAQPDEPGSSITGNRVRGLSATGTGTASGIISLFTAHLSIHSNDIVGDGSAGGFGIICYSSSSHARNNVIDGFATGVSVCSDDGNLIVP